MRTTKKSFKNTSFKNTSFKKKKSVNKKSNTKVNVAELTKKLKEEKENQDKGSQDEKGNPFPIDNPEGGDPICTGGYKIDYQFDMFDPINPPFRCIPTLKEDGDSGLANKMLSMANDPSSGVEDIMTGPMPGFGGKHRSRRRRSHRHRRSHRRSHRHRRKS
jgi:hypothetical protein